LLLLRQDPTKTIEAYADVVNVILGGRVLDPVQLAANHSRSVDRTRLNEVPGGYSARYQLAR
ncbi:MAG TPA: hypothetical protein VGM15_14005, partial [Burkholderiaceae bacterium]